MRFTIFDVGHGFCAYAVAENRNVMVFDCGHKSDPEYRPSSFLKDSGCGGIEYFVCLNYDQDHISDLPGLRSAFSIGAMVRNTTISADQLRELKKRAGPITSEMESLLGMIEQYRQPAQYPYELSGLEFTTFCNRYGDFSDTNNLSLVTFLDIGGLHVVMPGDLEVQGWEKLLESQGFKDALGKVNVFVASHHGRENGYCAEVFEHCEPSVIVMSDGPKVHATQEMVETYANHASGVKFNGEDRRVLTTRNDGTITWSLGAAAKRAAAG